MRRASLLLCLLALVALGACSDDEAFAKPVTIDAKLSPHPVSAISAVLSVSTSRDADVTVQVKGDGTTFDVAVGDDLTQIPVVGMRADSEYDVVVTATPEDADQAEEVLHWKTGSLPSDLPPVTLQSSDPDRAQPGVTVFNAMPFSAAPEGAKPGDAGYIVAVDGDGQVVWYDRMPLQILDVDVTPRNTFLVTAGETGIIEVDLLGRHVRDWVGRIATDGRGTDPAGRSLVTEDSRPVDIDAAHHEVTELPNGHVLTLSTELLELSADDAARLCPDKPSTDVIGDVVVELDADGKLVQEWKLSDVFDPVERPGAEMCRPQLPIAPPMWFYPEAKDVRDWTHANAIDLDEERNTLIVSLRHLDAVIGLRYHDDGDGTAGELLWELGPNGTIDLRGEPTAHQHAAELVGDDDELLVYDNGNDKGPPPYSRAVLYRFDPEAGTAEQVWEHRDTTPEGTPMFTPFLGDADLLDNGDVLITHGGAAARPGDLTSLYGRIVEVDRNTDDVVWDLLVGDRKADAWAVYRSQRFPSLYELNS